MDKINTNRKAKIYKAQGIVSVEGKYPSKLALEIAKQYAKGNINAEQAKQQYLNETLNPIQNIK